MTAFDKKLETMFESDMGAAKSIETAKPDEVDELDVRLAYLTGIAKAFDKHFPPKPGSEEPPLSGGEAK
jgi:hypothetical protein